MCRTEIVWSWVPTCWKKIDTPCIIFSPNHGKYLYYASALVEAGEDALIPYKNTLLATQHKTGMVLVYIHLITQLSTLSMCLCCRIVVLKIIKIIDQAYVYCLIYVGRKYKVFLPTVPHTIQ